MPPSKAEVGPIERVTQERPEDDVASTTQLAPWTFPVYIDFEEETVVFAFSTTDMPPSTIETTVRTLLSRCFLDSILLQLHCHDDLSNIHFDVDTVRVNVRRKGSVDVSLALTCT